MRYSIVRQGDILAKSIALDGRIIHIMAKIIYGEEARKGAADRGVGFSWPIP